MRCLAHGFISHSWAFLFAVTANEKWTLFFPGHVTNRIMQIFASCQVKSSRLTDKPQRKPDDQTHSANMVVPLAVHNWQIADAATTQTMETDSVKALDHKHNQTSWRLKYDLMGNIKPLTTWAAPFSTSVDLSGVTFEQQLAKNLHNPDVGINSTNGDMATEK